jgi:hypothetical protein
VLRHDNIPVHAEVEAEAHRFQALHEQIEQFNRCEIGTAVATTESYKVRMPGFLKAPKATRHTHNLRGAVVEVKYPIVGPSIVQPRPG